MTSFVYSNPSNDSHRLPVVKPYHEPYRPVKKAVLKIAYIIKGIFLVMKRKLVKVFFKFTCMIYKYDALIEHSLTCCLISFCS